MFERFTERARQVVVLAQEEARTLKHDYIGTEHLLLGLLLEQEGLAARVLGDLEISVERVRAQVVRIIGTGGEVTAGQIPFTPPAKKALETALRESLSLGHNFIGTEHLLLGLVRDGRSVAIQVLDDFGVSQEQVRDEVIRALSGPGPVPRRERPEPGPGAQREAQAASLRAAEPRLHSDVRAILEAAQRQASRRGSELVALEDLVRALFSQAIGPPGIRVGDAQALVGAFAEAVDLRHDHVGTEHLLLALLADPADLRSALPALGPVSRLRARGAIGGPPEEAARPPFTRPLLRTVRLAEVAAERLGHQAVRPEHLVIGLVAEGPNAAVALLRELEVDPRKVGRQAVALARGEEG